ncbi:MAG: hypothetical protein OEV50_05035 [Candidatus Aminicenantes bacterium]|nr:hypothetical protein [Candidatus Aminicenantes bacterium]
MAGEKAAERLKTTENTQNSPHGKREDHEKYSAEVSAVSYVEP